MVRCLHAERLLERDAPSTITYRRRRRRHGHPYDVFSGSHRSHIFVTRPRCPLVVRNKDVLSRAHAYCVTTKYHHRSLALSARARRLTSCRPRLDAASPGKRQIKHPPAKHSICSSASKLCSPATAHRQHRRRPRSSGSSSRLHRQSARRAARRQNRARHRNRRRHPRRKNRQSSCSRRLY